LVLKSYKKEIASEKEDIINPAGIVASCESGCLRGTSTGTSASTSTITGTGA